MTGKRIQPLLPCALQKIRKRACRLFPEQVSETNGMRAYESFEGRMEGVAVSSYQSLIAQRDRNAMYQSVFNMVWYGLRPLPLGMKDTSRPPTLEDGVYFTNFEEG